MHLALITPEALTELERVRACAVEEIAQVELSHAEEVQERAVCTGAVEASALEQARSEAAQARSQAVRELSASKGNAIAPFEPEAIPHMRSCLRISNSKIRSTFPAGKNNLWKNICCGPGHKQFCTAL